MTTMVDAYVSLRVGRHGKQLGHASVVRVCARCDRARPSLPLNTGAGRDSHGGGSAKFCRTVYPPCQNQSKRAATTTKTYCTQRSDRARSNRLPAAAVSIVPPRLTHRSETSAHVFRGHGHFLDGVLVTLLLAGQEGFEPQPGWNPLLYHWSYGLNGFARTSFGFLVHRVLVASAQNCDQSFGLPVRDLVVW